MGKEYTVTENGEKITIRNFTDLGDVGLALGKAYADYPDVKKLDLTTTSEKVDLAVLKPFQNLRELSIQPGVGGYGDWSLSAVINDVSQLKHLPLLETLSLSFIGKDLGSFAELGQIRHLSLSVNESNPDLEPIGRLVQLETLSLGIYSKWSYLYRDRIDSIAQLSGLVNLKKLNVSGLRLKSLAPVEKMLALEYLDCSDNCIRSVRPLKKLTELRELNLAGNKGLHDTSALSGLKKLTKLVLPEAESGFCTEE